MMFNKEITIVIFLKKNKNTKSAGDVRDHDSPDSFSTLSMMIGKDIEVVSSVSSQSFPQVVQAVEGNYIPRSRHLKRLHTNPDTSTRRK